MSLSLKDEFLKIQFFVDYESKEDHFKDLDFNDPDIRRHMNLMQANDAKRGIFFEAYKSPTKHWG